MKVCTYCQGHYVPDKRNYENQKYCSRLCFRRHYKAVNICHTKKVAKERYERMKNDPELWDKHKALGRKHRADWKGRLAKYKRQASERNIEFNLTRDEFQSLWGQDCTYCGDKIEGVGIDRVDNKQGYKLSNCVACCQDCNRFKHSQSMEKFIEKCKNTIRLATKCKKILQRHGES